MLFAALAPSVARAVASSPSDTWAEICSAAGITLVKVSGATAGEPDSTAIKAGHAKHCVFCAHDPQGPPSALSLLPVVMLPPQSHPALFYQAPSPLPAWAPAQSRAPPYLC